MKDLHGRYLASVSLQVMDWCDMHAVPSHVVSQVVSDSNLGQSSHYQFCQFPCYFHPL